MAPSEHRKSLLVVDLVGVLICAFIVGVNQDFSSHSGDEVSWGNFWRTVVLAIECYAIVAVLILPWKSQIIPKIPNWLLAPFLGSIVYYFAIHLVDYVTHGGTVLDFIVGMLLVTVIDCTLTLPLMALIHFLAY